MTDTFFLRIYYLFVGFITLILYFLGKEQCPFSGHTFTTQSSNYKMRKRMCYQNTRLYINSAMIITIMLQRIANKLQVTFKGGQFEFIFSNALQKFCVLIG